jgi:hypothetical protein
MKIASTKKKMPSIAKGHQILVLEALVVGNQHERREGDPEAGEDDVTAVHPSHLLARRQQSEETAAREKV